MKLHNTVAPRESTTFDFEPQNTVCITISIYIVCIYYGIFYLHLFNNYHLCKLYLYSYVLDYRCSQDLNLPYYLLDEKTKNGLFNELVEKLIKRVNKRVGITVFKGRGYQMALDYVRTK